MSRAPRWWIRNARTQQVLGSVFAVEEEEALGKAQVRYGIAGWIADKYTATQGGTGGTETVTRLGARVGDADRVRPARKRSVGV